MSVKSAPEKKFLSKESFQPEEHIRRLAIDPKSSIWVSANAGSGKTTILTYRVISLLLNGVDPSRILCLTYTRAAAAEMQNRVFDVLGLWVTLENDELRSAIQKIQGKIPDFVQLSFARRLFARAVETPGGLKIQTIHAFCERLLHLFPFESNVPARFRLMEETEQASILEACISSLQQYQTSGHDENLVEAISQVTQEAGESRFMSLIREALKWRSQTNQTGQKGDIASLKLSKALGLGVGDTEQAITYQIAFGQEPGFHEGLWTEKLKGFNKTDEELGIDLDEASKIVNPDIRAKCYISALLKADGPAVNSKKPTLKVQKTNPALYDILKNEQHRLVAMLEKRAAARALARTQALVKVTDEIAGLYAHAKRLRGLLDFDDVIHKADLLLQRSSSAWVLYKLDGGIDHLLVDEAQDTSPQQWSILTRLTEEFFTGSGVRNIDRTVFAVGDEKQSIYSFQGAAPDAFAEQKKLFQMRAQGIQQSFHPVNLQLSFRSTGDILSAVDATFGVEENFKGLSGDDPKPTIHETTRLLQPGLVEIWPEEVPEEDPDLDPHLEVDAVPVTSPAVKLAKRIAARVAYWIKAGCQFENDAKPINAGDIIILVRRRGTFFNSVIRALKAAGVPVAGADRLKLTDHIAVMDLLAVAEVALMPDDDLMLATVLKTPLIGLNDNDLMILCCERQDISLFQALKNNPVYEKAYNRIDHWRCLAATCSPYSFFSTILAADGGRKLIMNRLGMDAAEAMDVFLSDALNWQTKNMSSLFGFISFMRKTEREVKREFDNTPDCVRVMTVHAAKGLEARIVFLGDTFAVPSLKHAPKLFDISDQHDALKNMVWSGSKKTDTAKISTLRERWLESEYDEYRRLLYVGMTRARDRLYIGGYANKNKTSEKAWFKMIETALGRSDYLQNVEAEDKTGPVLQWRSVKSRQTLAQFPDVAKAQSFSIPDWLTRPLPDEPDELPPIRPSSASQAAERLQKTDYETAGLRKGILIHMLLQHLPNVGADERKVLADRLLELKAKDIPEKERANMRNVSINLLMKPEMEILLGANSKAEVEISGQIEGYAGKPVSARIDRMAVLETEVLIVDFKTGNPPADKNFIPPNILQQLALYKALVHKIYPSKTIKAGVVWTSSAELIFAQSQDLEKALSSIFP